MKKLLLLLLFIPLISFGQSINTLEDKNGYKIFKLNSDKKNYINNLKFKKNSIGYTTYTYVETAEYNTELKKLTTQKESFFNLASRYNTTISEIRKLNSNIKTKKSNVLKKGQYITVPVRKVSKKFPVDASLFNLFGNNINSISLTFDNSNNQLKKISLDLNQVLTPNHLGVLGFNLKKIYNNFAEVIGPTTHYNKPTSDCERFPSKTCLYFEDRVADGEILWESKNVVLRITHKIDLNMNSKGTINLLVSREVSFVDKFFDSKEKKSSF